MRFDTWRITICDAGGRQIRRLTFGSPDKVVEMAGRGGAFQTLADKQAVEYALRQGLGRCELQLTAGQFARLSVP